MNTKATFQSLVARALIVTVSVTMAPQAEGAMIGSERAIAGDRERILILLERPEVAAQLEAYGVRMSDAKARIAALTDAEAARLSAEIDSAHAGGRGDPISLMVMAVLFVVLLPFFILGALIYCTATKNKACSGSPVETYEPLQR